jgi:hypothetical protein
MTLVYQAIHAALLPIALHEVPHFLNIFLEHIGRRNEKTRPKQTELFLQQLQAWPSAVAAGRTSSSEQARASP